MIHSRQIICLYPWLALGGADKFNQDMLECLAAYGWRATIVTTCPSPHPWRGAFEGLSDDIIDLATCPPEQQPLRLLQTIRRRQIDSVFVSHSDVGYHLLPFLRAHLPELSYVDFCHIVETRRKDGGFPGMSLFYAQVLDLQIVSSQHLKDWMCERNGHADRIAVCTTNIDTAEWDAQRYNRAALRAALGLPLSASVILYAARLERQKQPTLAVSIMKQVVAQTPDTYFLIAGDGLFAGYLRAFLRSHNPEHRIRMLGAVSNTRMRELLALSDILFLPSQMEGISQAIYEAMSMGVVPVSAAVGGQAELVTPECGWLIPHGPNRHEAYIEALLRLAREPQLRMSMSQASRRRVVNSFPQDLMGARMNELLSLACTLHDAQPRPPVAAAVAACAADKAISAARGRTRKTVRRRIRSLYWRLVDRGAWWLVPLVEQFAAR
jgi:glycosyltransferase involved in cell wall biosynthesis